MNRNPAEQLPTMSVPEKSPGTESERTASNERLLSLDAYRGAIMVSLAFGGFGLAETAKRHLKTDTENSFWANVFYHFEHVEWTGCGYWDMIQPSFMFMVGVSMAYSYLKRQQLGHSYTSMFRHASTRAMVLILMGVFLSSNGSKATNWAFMNVLSQIGLGYAFLFLLWRRGFPVQMSCVTLLLAATWLLYVGYGGQGIDLKKGNEQVGITAEWANNNLANVAPAWHKNANVGHTIDETFLNWFPRQTRFAFNSGGYQTINFIPSLATMILGLICGEWLRSQASEARKFGAIVALGILCGALGWGLAHWGAIPMVKRIWTPSWALFSTGICCFILAGLYGVIDIMKIRTWSFPLVVVGTNSIAIYLMAQLLKPWVGRTLQTHLGQELFNIMGENYEPFVRDNLIGLAFWVTCLFLHKQRIFFRI